MDFPVDYKILPHMHHLVLGIVVILMSLKVWASIASWRVFYRLPHPKSSATLLGDTQLFNPRFHNVVSAWLNENGGIVATRFLWLKLVWISNPLLASEILASTPADGLERDPAYTNFQTGSNHPTMFTAKSSDPYWKSGRRLMASFFSVKHMRSTFPAVLKASEHLARILKEKGGEEQMSQEVSFPIKLLTLDVTGAALFDMDFQALESYESGKEGTFMAGWMETSDKVVLEMGKRSLDPARALSTFFDTEAAEGSRQIRGLHQRALELARLVRSKGSSESAAVMLSHAKDPKTGKRVDDTQLAQELHLLILAGTDTSSVTTAWTLFLVSQHPEVEAKIVEELTRAGLTGPQARPLTFDDLPQLDYLQAVIKESMRLKPAAAATTSKIATRDVILGGHYKVPKGVTITVLGYATFRDPALWDRPNDFVPERWLEAGCNPEFCQGANGEGSEKPIRKFYPFSAGHRDCVGRNLALMVVPTLLAVLYSRFTFRLADEMGGVKGVEEAETVWFTLSPGNGLKFQVMPRDSGIKCT